MSRRVLWLNVKDVAGHSGRLPAGIEGSNSAKGGWVFFSCECCVLSGRGLCVGLITRTEKTCRLFVVCK